MSLSSLPISTVTTVHDAFRILLHRIELNPTRVALASQRYNAIKDVIEREIEGATVRQIGSFQRHTKIRPLDLSDVLDVDALVVLGEMRKYAPQVKELGPGDCLKKVMRALRRDETYRIMEPENDSPVITLEYADGLKIEVAVGWSELTGRYLRASGPACYIVPSGEETGWIPADYDYDAGLISAANQSDAVRGALVPTIKLVKRWLRTHNVPLKSFHIEILCCLVLQPRLLDWHERDLSWGIPQAFAATLINAHEFLSAPIALPNSYSPPVDSGLKVGELQKIGKYLRKAGDNAWKLCQVDDNEGVIELWRDFFGDPFPPASAIQ